MGAIAQLMAVQSEPVNDTFGPCPMHYLLLKTLSLLTLGVTMSLYCQGT